MNLQLLSLNLWNVNEPVEERMRELVRFLRIVRPDVVALQEVSRIGGAPQSDIIASEAGYSHAHYAKSGLWFGREEGLAVVSLHRSSQLPVIELPLAQEDMQRIAQRVGVQLGQTDSLVEVVNTHFAFRVSETESRTAQARKLLQALKVPRQGGSRPLVICGDLNDRPESEPVRLLFEDSHLRLVDAWAAKGNSTGWTLASRNPWSQAELVPDRRIDYVGVSDSLRVQECSLVLTGDDGWGPVSDHYGILVRLSDKG